MTAEPIIYWSKRYGLHGCGNKCPAAFLDDDPAQGNGAGEALELSNEDEDEVDDDRFDDEDEELTDFEMDLYGEVGSHTNVQIDLCHEALYLLLKT